MSHQHNSSMHQYRTEQAYRQARVDSYASYHDNDGVDNRRQQKLQQQQQHVSYHTTNRQQQQQQQQQELRRHRHKQYQQHDDDVERDNSTNYRSSTTSQQQQQQRHNNNNSRQTGQVSTTRQNGGAGQYDAENFPERRTTRDADSEPLYYNSRPPGDRLATLLDRYASRDVWGSNLWKPIQSSTYYSTNTQSSAKNPRLKHTWECWSRSISENWTASSSIRPNWWIP